MILADTSVWLALVISGHVHNPAVREWFDALSKPRSVWFCRATQQSFLRLITTASVQARYGDPPLTNEAAWALYETTSADGRIAYVSDEPDGLEEYWRQYSNRSTSSPKLWMDAYLAAFARAGGYQVVTTDVAFRQFDGLDLLVLGNA